MLKNICHFVPEHNTLHFIHTIHFVLETKPQFFSTLKTESVYKMHYVRSGKGTLHTMGQEHPLKKGDVFFTFPSLPFCIESGDDFSYMYISFLGARGNQIMESLDISKKNYLFHGCDDVYTVWNSGISIASQMSDLMSESILLYTFSYLGNKNTTHHKNNNTALSIKKYVDDNFTDLDFSLKKIADSLSYNKKYISTVFKNEFGIGISEYVNTLRIQHACTLIKQGFTGINDIAFCSGYNDPQYFSRIFKQKQKITPSEYIKKKG